MSPDQHSRELERLARNFRFGMRLVDTDGRTLAISDEVCKIFGRSADELLAEGIAVAISHPDDLAREEPMRRELLGGQRERYAMAKRFTRSDGKPIRGYIDAQLVRERAGLPTKAVAIIITPRLPEVDEDRDAAWQFEEVEGLDAMRVLLAEKWLAEQRVQKAGRELAELVLDAVEAGTPARRLGELLGVSVNTVHSWAHRARRRRR